MGRTGNAVVGVAVGGGVFVVVGVRVNARVFVGTAVWVAVFCGVFVRVAVRVFVGTLVSVAVLSGVFVLVAVLFGVFVRVGVAWVDEQADGVRFKVCVVVAALMATLMVVLGFTWPGTQ